MNKNIGIYCIRNLVNNKIYVGASFRMHTRKSQHWSDLKANRHVNKHMQYDFNNVGEDYFEHFTIQLCSKERLDVKEKYWIEKFNSNNHNFGYNLTNGGHTFCEYARFKAYETSRNRTGEKHHFYGKHHTEETKQKIKYAIKDRIRKPHSEETKQKISESLKGHPSLLGRTKSAETIRKQIENNPNVIKITKEMETDVINGMSRRKFQKKYGNVGAWNRIYKNNNKK